MKGLGVRPKVWSWMRENLFSSWMNSALTVLMLYLTYQGAASLAGWVFGSARWGVVSANFANFMVGTYPRTELWRIWTVVGMVSVLTGWSAGTFGRSSFRIALTVAAAGATLMWFPFTWVARGLIAFNVALLGASFLIARGRRGRPAMLAAAWVLSMPVTFLMLRGVGGDLLPQVETSAWGGLTLTLILAVIGIAFSLPIGIVLALSRQSELPAIRWVCTAFIEIVRGTPLVAVIFMAHLLTPIFLPDLRIDKVVRAMIGFTVFTSAYVAENVRGGLQGVPKGQYEAAQALGLGGGATMLLVILPQALRSVIPSIVGQFISLFKDTSLVAIVGLIDLMGIARSVVSNPEWLGLHREVFLFAAAIYWIFSFTLSKASRGIEARLGVGR